MAGQEACVIRFDADLNIEAYRFYGWLRKFPNHFHDYYVIGCICGGRRRLICHNEESVVESGDLLLFNPGDSHACEQVDNQALDWRCLNIKPEVIQARTREITGKDHLPRFSPPVARRAEQVPLLRELHEMILEEREDFQKEECFLALLDLLLEEYAGPFARPRLREEDAAVRLVRAHLEEHYTERISLEDLCALSGLDKYGLLRAFTRCRGITPYRYLENVRIARAKSLLEEGVPPVEAALRTGFTDQSHFTKFFKCFIGLTPRQYQRIFKPADPEPGGSRRQR